MKPERMTLRSLKNPSNVATALHTIDAARISIPAMFDRCQSEVQCVHRHIFAGKPWYYCGASDLTETCRWRTDEFAPSPNVPVDVKPRTVPAHVSDWCLCTVAEIAAQDDGLLGSTATSWLLDSWDSIDKLKPRRKMKRSDWRVECQMQLFEAIAQMAVTRKPWERKRVV